VEGDEDMKAYFLPFSGAFVVFALVFLALNYVIMKLQGLSLVFH
jgi:hypothetical protein